MNGEHGISAQEDPTISNFREVCQSGIGVVEEPGREEVFNTAEGAINEVSV